ncbi:hypothetical protein OH76DRAFT_727884 [Lentinus brumalis]|uniref:Uncharacterized protein n=1 Tax=Lentinus brumalis TaxID=2498619 RepID=A0A371D5A4_9APHY|nr:hypothetical protein OH76DRAFT_727884 [Polyporus brumalis]
MRSSSLGELISRAQGRCLWHLPYIRVSLSNSSVALGTLAFICVLSVVGFGCQILTIPHRGCCLLQVRPRRPSYKFSRACAITIYMQRQGAQQDLSYCEL